MALDSEALSSYGWSDLLAERAFREADGENTVRYAMHPAMKTEILDRLLELNLERASAESHAADSELKQTESNFEYIQSQKQFLS